MSSVSDMLGEARNRKSGGVGDAAGGGAPIFEGRVFLNSAILHGARVYLWLERIL